MSGYFVQNIDNDGDVAEKQFCGDLHSVACTLQPGFTIMSKVWGAREGEKGQKMIRNQFQCDVIGL
jgi:hypothetical protein